jgi:flagellar protein FlgJ
MSRHSAHSRRARRLLVGPALAIPATAVALGLGVDAAHAATAAATVQVSSGTLNVRSAASTSSSIVRSLRNGNAIDITCKVTGQWINGSLRSTSQWDRLATGGYVSHAYVATAAAYPACSPSSPSSAPTVTPTPAPAPVTVAGTVATDGGPLNVRVAPTTGATIVGSMDNNASFTIVCRVNGESITGYARTTNQWDKRTDGTFVSDAYVRTAAPVPTCAAAAMPEPTGSMTNEQFVAAAAGPAQRAQREYGVPASVTIAQAILESGWGRSGLAAQDKNYFGIKCFSGSPGPVAVGCHSWATHECEPTCLPTTASFRVYASVTDSFRDHAIFLTTNSRYKPAFSYTKDANMFIYQVWKAGYATSPTYYDNVTNIMRKYNLYQYDNA